MVYASLTTHIFSSAAIGIEPGHMSLISRQLDSSTIPAACQPICQSAMSIYSDCTSGNTSGCRQVCQQSTFNEFIDCLDCTSEQLAMTTSEQSMLKSAVEQLKNVCGQTGSSVTGTLAWVIFPLIGEEIHSETFQLEAYLSLLNRSPPLALPPLAPHPLSLTFSISPLPLLVSLLAAR